MNHPTVTRVFVDDLTLYRARAAEYGVDGEYLDVYVPAMPSHLISQIGQRCSVRLEYDTGEHTSDVYVLESTSESLESGEVIMRLVLE